MEPNNRMCQLTNTFATSFATCLGNRGDTKKFKDSMVLIRKYWLPISLRIKPKSFATVFVRLFDAITKT